MFVQLKFGLLTFATGHPSEMSGRALGYDAIPERRQHDGFGEALRRERAMRVDV